MTIYLHYSSNVSLPDRVGLPTLVAAIHNIRKFIFHTNVFTEGPGIYKRVCPISINQGFE